MGGFGELCLNVHQAGAPPSHSPISFLSCHCFPYFHSLDLTASHVSYESKLWSGSRSLCFLLTALRPALAPTLSAYSYSAINLSPPIWLLSSQLDWCLLVLEKNVRKSDLISSFLKKNSVGAGCRSPPAIPKFPYKTWKETVLMVAWGIPATADERNLQNLPSSAVQATSFCCNCLGFPYFHPTSQEQEESFRNAGGCKSKLLTDGCSKWFLHLWWLEDGQICQRRLTLCLLSFLYSAFWFLLQIGHWAKCSLEMTQYNCSYTHSACRKKATWKLFTKIKQTEAPF